MAGSYLPGLDNFPSGIDEDRLAAGLLAIEQGRHSQQSVTEAVLVSGVDATLGEDIVCTLTANRVLGRPLNGVAGQRLQLVLTQGGAGNFTLTAGTGVTFSNFALNATAGAVTTGSLVCLSPTSWVVASNPASALASSTSLPAAGTTLTGGPLIGGKVWDYGGQVWHMKANGAKFDGQTVSDGVMNGTTAVLTSASNKFVAADVNKLIVVPGAGAAGVTLSTTIASYQSAGQVTLAAVSQTAVTQAVVIWGTDDAAVDQAVITAANAAGGGGVFAAVGMSCISVALALLSSVQLMGAGYGSLIQNMQVGYSGGADVAEAITIGKNVANPAAPALSSNVAIGATSVVVASAASLAAGQNIQIWDTFFAEVNQIAASYVAGNTTIPLVWPARYAYTTARGAQLGLYAWVTNWGIDKLRISGTTTSGSAIAGFQCLDGMVTNCSLDNHGGRGILFKNWAARNRAVNNSILTSGQVVANIPILETYVTTSDNEFLGNRVFGGTSHGVAMHGFHNACIGNQVWGHGAAGIHCDTGSDLLIVGNVSSDNVTNGIDVNGAGADFTTNVRTATITGNTTAQNLGAGLFLGGSSGLNCRVVATGNSIFANAQGVNFQANLQGFTVSGNLVKDNTTGFVIGASVDFGTVIGNTMDGNGTTATGAFGANSNVLANRGINNNLTDPTTLFGNTTVGALISSGTITLTGTAPTVGSGGAGVSALSVIAGSNNTEVQVQATLTAIAPGVVIGVVTFNGGPLAGAPKAVVCSLSAPTAGVASPPIVGADTYTNTTFTIRSYGPTTVTTGTYIITCHVFF